MVNGIYIPKNEQSLLVQNQPGFGTGSINIAIFVMGKHARFGGIFWVIYEKIEIL
jgi:hypothetical protein